jgi:arabinofuranan 3-O-arabinosyltransferase
VKGDREQTGYLILRWMRTWIGNRWLIAVLFWIAAFAVAGFLLSQARVWFAPPSGLPEERRRVDGNSGHTQIDFGGQWVMGRMIVAGHGRELYHRQRQWEVVREGFPIADEAPLVQAEAILPGKHRVAAKADEDLQHDADRLMGWVMGSDPLEWRIVGGAVSLPLSQGPISNPLHALVLHQRAGDAVSTTLVEELNQPAIGGPLYPPIHAFFYAPLALDRPLRAYHNFQIVATVMVFVAGLGVYVLSNGRIWWSVATLLLFLYPGTRAGLDLGQNPTVTLAIAVWGWALAARGYNTAGGVVWGLFAFKPVWALAFLIVPILTRRWRFLAAMVVTGAGFIAVSLPFVGLQTWFDWLTVGKEAANLYNVNQNWINLSRDLQGIPRRILHDYSIRDTERDTPLAKTLAWVLWGTVFAATVGLYLRYANHRRATGIGAGFLFFGAWLTCYRFMYYDALISAAGCAVLFAEPARFLRTRIFHGSSPHEIPTLGERGGIPVPAHEPQRHGPRIVGYINSFPLTIVALLYLVENSLAGLKLEVTFGLGYLARVTTGPGGESGFATPQIMADTAAGYPWETFLVLALWVWCGWRLIRGDDKPNS